MAIENTKTLNMAYGSEKRIFIFLLLVTCIIATGGAIILFLVPYIDFTNIHPKLPLIVAVIMGTAYAAAFCIAYLFLIYRI